MRLLAIDPGRDTGWAVFEDGALSSAGLGDPPALCSPDKVVIERPQIYPGRMSRVDPNDIVTLAIGVGRYTEKFSQAPVEHVLPHTWKGTLDPDVLCRRVWACLSAAEQTILATALEPLGRKSLDTDLTGGKRHNVLDAVGLGKWSLVRARAGVFR